MKRTAKRPAKCPICGTTYKVPSMAARCMRTPACRFYNAPGGERREAFRHQLCVGEVVAYTCDPLKKSDVPQIMEGAELALSGIDRLVPALHSLAINTRVFHLIDADMSDLLTTIWPLHVKTDVVHIVAIASNLVCDLKTVQGEWLESSQGRGNNGQIDGYCLPAVARNAHRPRHYQDNPCGHRYLDILAGDLTVMLYGDFDTSVVGEVTATQE